MVHASRVHGMGIHVQARRPHHKDGRSLMEWIVVHASRVHGMGIHVQARRPHHKVRQGSLRVALWGRRPACRGRATMCRRDARTTKFAKGAYG